MAVTLDLFFHRFLPTIPSGSFHYLEGIDSPRQHQYTSPLGSPPVAYSCFDDDFYYVTVQFPVAQTDSSTNLRLQSGVFGIHACTGDYFYGRNDPRNRNPVKRMPVSYDISFSRTLGEKDQSCRFVLQQADGSESGAVKDGLSWYKYTLTCDEQQIQPDQALLDSLLHYYDH